MTRRRKQAPAWGHLPTCPLCGGQLIWPWHTPKAGRRSKQGRARPIPLDADPTEDQSAPYACGVSKRTCRWVEPDEDVAPYETRHHSHIYTCPERVTPEQLADPVQQIGLPL